jgi:hypothetical protein
MDLSSLPTDFSIYTKWSGILTLACLVLTIVALIAKWGFRFRLVGVTGFMAVLTVGLFGLSLGLSPRVSIPGAVRYTLAYDNSTDQVVVIVPNDTSPEAIEPTLRQAAADFYSPGRIGPEGKMTVRIRTVTHPETGVSKPLYLGEIKRSLRDRYDENMSVTLFEDKFIQLTPPKTENS